MTMCRCCWASLQRCGWVQLMRIWFQDISSEQLLLKSCWLMITRAYNGLYYRTIYIILGIIWTLPDISSESKKWVKDMRIHTAHGDFIHVSDMAIPLLRRGWNPPLCHKMRRMVTEFPYSGIQRTVGAVRQISELKFLRNRDASSLVLKSFFCSHTFHAFHALCIFLDFFWSILGNEIAAQDPEKERIRTSYTQVIANFSRCRVSSRDGLGNSAEVGMTIDRT